MSSTTTTQKPEGESDPVGAAHVRRVRRWTITFGCAMVLGMSVGNVFRPLGSAGETRVADWIDLLTPFAILGTGTMLLSVARPGRGARSVFAVGAIAFAMGHGMHVGANSISNVEDLVVARADIVHLWDEVVSHYIAYGGQYLVLVAVVWALHNYPIGLQFGEVATVAVVTVSLATTYIEGDVAWFGLALFAGGVAAGVRWGRSYGTDLATAVCSCGLIMMVGWGVYWYAADRTVFPEFSDVGWI